ncbi:hypothetical protein E3Q13_01007 [Wallemia mellicola]|nr:hypothetical protein E3Q13_01007 [Wallemia mellicola]
MNLNLLYQLIRERRVTSDWLQRRRQIISKHLLSLADQHSNEAINLDRKIRDESRNPKPRNLPLKPKDSRSQLQLLEQVKGMNTPSIKSLKDSSSSEPSFDDSYSYLRAPNPESSDPFDRYWGMIEGMINNISNPVAFATAPLDGLPTEQASGDKRDTQLSSSFEMVNDPNAYSDNDKRSSMFTTAANMFQNIKTYSLNFTSMSSDKQTEAYAEDLQRASKVIKELMSENTTLKARLSEYERREKMHEALKGSIIKFGSEYRSRVESNGSPTSASVYQCKYNNRQRELEIEMDNLKLELQNKNKQLKKHKDRWEMLKQTAGKRKLGLGNIKNQIAHNQFLSALGNKDLKVLQDVITSEKVSMASSMSASKDTEKVAEAVKSWGWGEGDDLKDVCAVAGSLLHQHAGATATAASYQTKIREQFKRIRTREEELDELRRRRKTLSGKIESAEKKLAKMNSENKNLPQQTQLLESFRQQAADLDVEIVNSEAMIWDYKRTTTKTALGYKFCSLVEFAEKVSIIGEMAKEIQLEPSIPGQPHPPYNGAEQTRKILEQAEKSLSEVTFGPLPLTSRPPELDVSANDFAPRIESRDVRFDDTVDSGFNRDIAPDPHIDYDEPPPPLEEAKKPWTHQNNSYLSVDSDFRTSSNPNAYPNDSYTSANAYSSFDGLSPPVPNLNEKPRSIDNISIGAAPEGASHQSPSANSLRRARGDKTQYDYDTSAFFSRNHAGGFNDAPVLNSFTPAPVLDTKPPMSVSAPGSALGTPLNGSTVNVNELHDNSNEPALSNKPAEAYEQPQEIQFEKRHDSLQDNYQEKPAEVRFDVPSAGHYEEPADVHYNKPKEVHYEEPRYEQSHYEQTQRPQETMTGIGLLNTSPSPPPQLPGFEEVADEIPRYQLNDNSYTHPNEAPQAPPKEDIYGGIEDDHPTSPLPNPYDTPFNPVAEPPSHDTFDNENSPQFSFSNNHAMANQPRMLTAGAFKRSNKQESPTGSDTTPPLNINKRDTSYVNNDAPVGPPPPRGDSLT